MIQRTAQIITSTPRIAMNTATIVPPKTLESGGIILSQLMISNEIRPITMRLPAAIIPNFNFLFFGC